MLGVAHQIFDGRLVVQDHLGFQRILALGGLAEFDQPLGIETAVGVALQLRGCPGQINQQAVEDVAGKGARWGLVARVSGPGVQLVAQALRQISGLIGVVLLKKPSL